MSIKCVFDSIPTLSRAACYVVLEYTSDPHYRHLSRRRRPGGTGHFLSIFSCEYTIKDEGTLGRDAHVRYIGMLEPVAGHFYKGQPVLEAADRAKQYLPATPSRTEAWEAIAKNHDDSISVLGGLHHALTLYDTENVKLRNQVAESNKIQKKYNDLKLYGTLTGLPMLAIITGFVLRAIWPIRASSTQS